jgi:hypothetical protein
VSPDDFYEDDEAAEDILAAFEAGDKGITEHPLTYSFIDPTGFVTLTTNARLTAAPTFAGQPMTRYWP